VSHISSPFYSVFLEMRGISQTICLGWPQTLILLISPSHVSRITGVSQQCLAALIIFQIGSHFIFAQGDLRLGLTYLCLSLDWEYRWESQHSACLLNEVLARLALNCQPLLPE
jgi:hypothetical protein